MSREQIFNQVKRTTPGFSKKNISITSRGKVSNIVYKKTFIGPKINYSIFANNDVEFRTELIKLFKEIQNNEAKR